MFMLNSYTLVLHIFLINNISAQMDQEQDFYKPEQKTIGAYVRQYDQNKESANPKIIISGFPYDEGTRRNNGRIGGAVASMKFKQILQQIQLYPSQPIEIYDSGDIPVDQQLENAHEELAQKHFDILSKKDSKALLFSIGGSNDQSYPNAVALMKSYPTQKIGVINLDSHFDVRPLKEGKAHSGSPFRLMLQDQNFKKNESKFIQFGVKGATTSKAHFQYLKSHNANIYWMQKDIRFYSIEKESIYRTQGGALFAKILQKLSTEVAHIFVSFDSDVISSKWMPGVSAPSVIGGLDSSQAIQIMEAVGRCEKVRLVDCSQFNPAVESRLSGHLLVQMFFALSMSFAARFQTK